MQLGCVQPDFDPRAWTEGLLSKIQGISSQNIGKHLLKARILPATEWKPVTIAFNESPLSLKKSKPSYTENQRVPGTLAAWNKRRNDAKLTFISETAFPSQKGGIFIDPTEEEKRSRTFLYHRTVCLIRKNDDELLQKFLVP